MIVRKTSDNIPVTILHLYVYIYVFTTEIYHDRHIYVKYFSVSFFVFMKSFESCAYSRICI